jgi:hypothetical protein
MLGGFPLWLVITIGSGSHYKYLNQNLFKVLKPQNNWNQGTIGMRELIYEPNLDSRLDGTLVGI